MGIGSSKGAFYDNEFGKQLGMDLNAPDKNNVDPDVIQRDPAQIENVRFDRDYAEMASNEKSGDFQSRFGAVDTIRRPEGAEEAADALKASVAPKVPSVREKAVESVLKAADDMYAWKQSFNKGLGDSVTDAVTLPGDVFTGKLPMTVEDPTTGDQTINPQVIERTTNLALMMIHGPAPVAAKMADGTLGSFAGVKSQTLNRANLYKASEMDLDKIHPDTIWKETGFFKGADGQWRSEIPDAGLKLKPEGFDKIIDSEGKDTALVPRTTTSTMPEAAKNDIHAFMKWIDSPTPKPLFLKDIIDHPELFKAYPQLSNLKVAPLPDYLKGKALGMFDGSTLHLGELHPDMIPGIVMHEVQHSIQSIENFAKGGNAASFVPKDLPAMEKNFKDLSWQVKQKMQAESGVSYGDIGRFTSAVEWQERGVNSPFLEGIVKEAKDRGVYENILNMVRSQNAIDKAKEFADNTYKRLAGEVESRNVQTRLDYDEAMRLHNRPTTTEDIPRNEQIRSSKDLPSFAEPPKPANDNNPPHRISNESKARLDAGDAIIKEMDQLSDIMKVRNWTDLESKRYFKLVEDHKKLFPDD